MSTTTYAYTSTFTVMECAACHMDFGVPEFFERARRGDHGTFHCPAGHSNYYPGKSESESLREQLDASRSIAKRERDRRERAERQRAAARGQVTKIKRRVGRGVCPCCNRSFADLGRHMSGQHPEFADGEA